MDGVVRRGGGARAARADSDSPSAPAMAAATGCPPSATARGTAGCHVNQSATAETVTAATQVFTHIGARTTHPLLASNWDVTVTPGAETAVRTDGKAAMAQPLAKTTALNSQCLRSLLAYTMLASTNPRPATGR